jgi:hypothetical protein
MLICINCNASIGNSDKISNSYKGNILDAKENDSIMGTWKISKSISNEKNYEKGDTIKTESTILCNVCPTIILKNNGEGFLLNAVGDESSFNWVIDKDKIRFSFNKKSDENLFFSRDKEFQFKIIKNSKNYILELIRPKDKSKYVLIR